MFFFSMLAWNIGLSLLKWPGFGPATFIGLDNYVRLARDSDFWESWAHAAWYIVPFAVLPTALALVLAAVSIESFIGRWLRKLAPLARSGLFLPQIVPISISALIWLGLVDAAGHVQWLKEPTPALVLVSVFMLWLQTGFAYIVLIAGLSRLHPSLLEAAELDGAGRWQRLRYVMLPALRSELFVVLVFLGAGALKVFAPVYYLTGGGPYGSTQTPATFAIGNFFGGKSVGYAAAVTTVSALVIALALAITFTIARRMQARR